MLDLEKYQFVVRGTSVVGRQIARQWGVPTVNLPYDGDVDGIFLARVWLEDQWWPAVAHLGARPSVDDSRSTCEFHLLNWQGDLAYGLEFEVRIYRKLRDVLKFDNLADLREQILLDVAEAKRCYNLP